jgi:thiosulfate/3-mercaptopyruvate sulfurtransferase
MSSYAHPEVLVETQWVAEHLTAPKVRIVEIGYDLSDYNSGHIPGAIGWAWSTDFQHPIRKDLPDQEGIEDLLDRSGIENNTTILVYGTRRNGYATFALWLLKIYGHGDVRVMNGNREKWITEGHPLETEIPTFTPSIMVNYGKGGNIQLKPANAVVISPVQSIFRGIKPSKRMEPSSR